jgi:hypothetical protein
MPRPGSGNKMPWRTMYSKRNCCPRVLEREELDAANVRTVAGRYIHVLETIKVEERPRLPRTM